MTGVKPKDLVEVACPYLNKAMNSDKNKPVVEYKVQVFLNEFVPEIICPEKLENRAYQCPHTSGSCKYILLRKAE